MKSCRQPAGHIGEVRHNCQFFLGRRSARAAGSSHRDRRMLAAARWTSKGEYDAPVSPGRSPMVLWLLGGLAEAQAPDPLRRPSTTILNGQPVPAEMFDQSFLAVVPIGQLNTIVRQTLGVVGPPESILAVADGYLVTYRRVRNARCRSVSMATARSSACSCSRRSRPARTLRPCSTTLRPCRAETSHLVLKDGEVLHAHNETEPLAVGSAFKLGVLAVLKRRYRHRRTGVGRRRDTRGATGVAADRHASRPFPSARRLRCIPSPR